ncbi:phage terminase small subunit [Vibrio litoralis]|uniref:phage terminase small subunit n=1 Tax=Vibrio litoralis TaxID=335972 RepID=UPI00041DEF7D|nr:phage terminase small subunit [Vibrio litoralis]
MLTLLRKRKIQAEQKAHHAVKQTIAQAKEKVAKALVIQQQADKAKKEAETNLKQVDESNLDEIQAAIELAEQATIEAQDATHNAQEATETLNDIIEAAGYAEDSLSDAIDKAHNQVADNSWSEMQHKLKMDLEYARTLAGSEDKIPFKLELIKKYKPHVMALLQTHENLEGLDVIWWWYQWQIDCGQFEEFHDSFKALILRGLDTPRGWKSNGETAYCDIVFQYSHKAHKAKTPFNRQYLMDAVQDLLSGAIATNAPLKVKMFRLVGDWFESEGKQAEALALFERVMMIDPNKGGRKTKVNELKEALGYE